MKPIGPLMHEHRLIERMISVINHEIKEIKTKKIVDTAFIHTVVDFIRVYADKTHHGKEEDILFRDLKNKKLYEDHNKIMQELIDEHKYGRKKVKELIDATKLFSTGSTKSPIDVVTILEEITEFYPRHIKKEDKEFFFPVMEYFTKKEQDAMLSEFYDFDRKMVHEIYTAIVENHEKNISQK